MTPRKTAKSIVSPLAAALVSLFAVCEAVAATVLYVKPGGTGAGTSWSDAAALETAVATAKSAGGECDLYLAKGVYYPAATIQLSNGISLYGGFKGDGSDSLGTRDFAGNATILCGDVDRNDYWEHHDAGTGTVTAMSDSPVIDAGGIAIPAFTSEYDTYAPASASLADNLMRLLAVQANATVVLDGVVLVGGGVGNRNKASQKDDGYNYNWGSGLLAANGAQLTVRNCRVVACSAQYSVVHFGTGVTTLEDSSVEHCLGFQYAAVTGAEGATASFTNCTFRGNARVNNSNSWMSRDESAAAVRGFANMTMNGCLFERNTLIKTYGGRHCAAAALSLQVGGNLRLPNRLVGLKFVGNVTWSGGSADAGQPSPIVSFGNQTLKPSGWLFERNVGFSSNVEDPLRIGLLIDTDYPLYVDNSTFVSNVLYVTGLSAESHVALAPVVSSKMAEFLNCTFFENDVVVSQSAGADVRASRALLSYRDEGDTDRCWVGAFNGTFSGEAALPDIVVAGFQTNDVEKCSFAGNSILWATGAAAAVPRAVAYGNGVADFVELTHCIVRAPELLASRVKTTGYIVEEDPLLAYFCAPGSVPVLRCGAKTPKIRDSLDVRVYLGSTGFPILTYMAGGATSGGETRCGSAARPTAALAEDALGAARASGSFTLGAVQSLAPIAESGVTVCCRVRPNGAGTVAGARFATVVGEVGDVLGPIAAASSDGRLFDSWRNDAMELLSDVSSCTPSTAAAGSYYADAWFVDAAGEIAIAPGDDLQAAIALAAAKGAGTVRLGAGVYQPGGALSVTGGNVTVRSEGDAVIDTGTVGAKLFDVYGTRDDHGWGTKLVFDGVTFSRGRVDVGYAEAEFLDCRLQGCTESGIVLSSRTNLLLSGTTFVGNKGLTVACPVTSGDLHASCWTVSNCCFSGNVGDDSGVGISSGIVDLEVVGTRFEDNISTVSGLCRPSANALCLIRSCVFSGNAFSNTTGILYFPMSSPMVTTISNCLLVANRLTGPQTADAGGAAIVYGGSGYMVFNTTFLSNVVDVTRTKQPGSYPNGYHASITGGRNSYGLVNCHFEGNRTAVEALADGLHLYSSTSAFLRQGRFPFVGCSYYDNTFADGEIYMDRWDGTLAYNLKPINCIFWGDAADYVPFGWYDASKNRLDVYNCVVKNAPSEGRSETSIVNSYERLKTSDPMFGPLAWRDGRAYRPLGRGSAFRSGALVGLNASGDLIFRRSDGDYYRCAPEVSVAKQTLAAASGDMFGDLPSRASGRPDIGPVQNTSPVPGMYIIVH